MDQKEFIKWLEKESRFEKVWDLEYQELQNYSEGIYDRLEVLENSVIFHWEDSGWGWTSPNSDQYAFADFIERYTNYELR